MTIYQLKKIYDSVANRRGWNFSSMKTESEPVPWNYIEIVINYLKRTDYVLDIGTGGGEKFIELSKHFYKGVGIDNDPNMIKTAWDNVTKNNNAKVSFELMDTEEIKFPQNTFDVVINRHAPVVPKQVAKVLKQGGYFITQQVAKDNMQNIKEAFKYKKVWQNDTETLSRIFEENGCRIIATGKYNVQYWVKDIESLIFWLKAIDLPEKFNIEEHGSQCLSYIKQFSTPKGFITNESREFLVAQKVK